jgi:hypothetical protein
VRIYREIAVPADNFSNGVLRKNPTITAIAILDQLIFLVLTPFVSKQLNANNTKAKNFGIWCENRLQSVENYPVSC